MENLLTSEAFLGILGAIVTAAIAAASLAFQRFTGVEIEAKYKDSLHSAIITGIESALKDKVIPVGTPEGAQGFAALPVVMAIVTPALRAHVMKHIKKSVPDAYKKLAPSDEVIDNLIDRYAREALVRLRK